MGFSIHASISNSPYDEVHAHALWGGMHVTGEVTQLLGLWAKGDAGAGERLWPLVYEDLRRIARRHVSGERAGHTLDPTALVHEAWMQIGPENAEQAANRGQYLAFASSVMRSYLVDHARRSQAEKRGGGRERVTLAGIDAGGSAGSGGSGGSGSGIEVELIALHDMLEELSVVDAELGRIAELRIFGGLTQAEIAEVVGLPLRTLERRWRVASTWLQRELER